MCCSKEYMDTYTAAPSNVIFDLQNVMSHPWVTDEGRVLLTSCTEMGLGLIEVTAQEQLGAIDRGSVVSMIRARLKEKMFRSKEYLFRVVSAASCGWEGL